MFSLPLTVILRHAHLALALGVAAVVGLMILPIPPALLDLLIAFNIASSILLLMLALYIPGVLGLSTFPTLILLTTVLRLALNIASTKQILLHAHAGHIIETFGRLVMGGSVAVGLVAFSIIAVVQFIVISKGAERVAEVGARFTLDALPGRQMSIEADLRAAIIDKLEAQRRRAKLQHESHLHGAMDGAMKFVKGDAIAAIIIAIVNIVAGIGIGTASLGMPFGEAVSRFTLLSVGDGMVSQIPSLLTSVAAGIFITRSDDQAVSRSSGLAAQIGAQLLAQPLALLASSIVLAGMALVPGFPKLVFVVLACAAAVLGWHALRRQRPTVGLEHAAPGPGGALLNADESAAAPVAAADLIVVPLVLRLSAHQRERLSPERLQQAFECGRLELQCEVGLPFPRMQVRFDEKLGADEFSADVQELPALRRQLPADLPEEQRESWIAARVIDLVRSRPDAFVGTQEIQALVKKAHEHLPELSDEVARAMNAQRLAEVLRRLALEGVSLRYLREIYESLLTWNGREKDIAMLTEQVRVELGRFICHRLLDGERRLHAVTVDASTEAQLREAVQQGPSGAFLALHPEAQRPLIEAAQACVERLPEGIAPTLVATMETRRFLRRLLVQKLPQLTVLSYSELPADVRVVSVARLSVAGGPKLRLASQDD